MKSELTGAGGGKTVGRTQYSCPMAIFSCRILTQVFKGSSCWFSWRHEEGSRCFDCLRPEFPAFVSDLGLTEWSGTVSLTGPVVNWI